MKLSEDCLLDLRDLMIASTEHPDVKGDVFNLVDVIGDELKHYEFEYGDFDGGCFQNGKDHMVCMTINEAKNIYHDFAAMYVIAKGTYPKDGMRKPYTLDIFKMQIEQAEGK